MRILRQLNLCYIVFILLFMQFFISSKAFAEIAFYELDNIRAELSNTRDKTSKNYIKNKQRLTKIISQNNIDYSFETRLKDVERLIKEQKYTIALYEINDLNENGADSSLCKELLGDIYKKNSKPKDALKAYKESLKLNPQNTSARFKLTKLYFENNKNAYGINGLNYLVSKTDNRVQLLEYENYIKTKVTPKDNFEANNLYEILGNIYLKTNKINASFAAYAKAISLNPADIYLKYYLADLLYKYKRTQEAIEMYNLILEEFPTDSQIRTAKAKSLINEGQVLNANKEYLIILEQYPESSQAKYGIYKIYENKLEPDKILERINSNNITYKATKQDILDFANVLEDMEDYKGAEAFREFAKDKFEVNQIIKDKSVTLKEEIPTKSSIAKNTTNKTTAAKNTAAKNTVNKTNALISQKPTNIIEEQKPKTQTTNKAKIKDKIELTKSTEETLKESEVPSKEPAKLPLKEQIRELPKEPSKELPKTTTQTTKNKTTAKSKTTAQAQTNVPIDSEFGKTAIIKEQQKAMAKDAKKYAEYEKIIKQYDEITPKTTQIYCAMANTYKMAGQPISALQYYKEAHKMNPTDSDLNYNVGLAYLELNKAENAREYITKAINLDSNNKKAHNLLSFINQKIATEAINKAFSEFENKNYIEAMTTLDDAINRYPEYHELYYYRALVFDAMNRNAAQIMDLRKTIELNPAYYMAYYQLGLAYEKIKDGRNALIAYERFLSIEPDDKELVNEVQKKVISLGSQYY